MMGQADQRWAGRGLPQHGNHRIQLGAQGLGRRAFPQQGRQVISGQRQVLELVEAEEADFAGCGQRQVPGPDAPELGPEILVGPLGGFRQPAAENQVQGRLIARAQVLVQVIGLGAVYFGHVGTHAGPLVQVLEQGEI